MKSWKGRITWGKQQKLQRSWVVLEELGDQADPLELWGPGEEVGFYFDCNGKILNTIHVFESLPHGGWVDTEVMAEAGQLLWQWLQHHKLEMLEWVIVVQVMRCWWVLPVFERSCGKGWQMDWMQWGEEKWGMIDWYLAWEISSVIVPLPEMENAARCLLTSILGVCFFLSTGKQRESTCVTRLGHTEESSR